MDASGTPREGWMAIVPIAVFLFMVIYILGGPEHVVNLMVQWTTELASSVANWVRHL